jgi:dimeric dUTPase (all-alpha-NTP-PPase superfamily)
MVNIVDVDREKVTGIGCRLQIIFDKQEELMKKYHPIEERSGLRLCMDCPVDLHDPRGQSTIKDYAWRFVEELGESLEAYNLHSNDPNHYREELSDALHFLVELSLHAGAKPQDIISMGEFSNSDRLDSIFRGCGGSKRNSYPNMLIGTGLVVENIAMTCNTLKNKPWKQSHMLTDVNRFKECLSKTWVSFIALCKTSGMNADYLFEIYMDKNAVNQFRQRSKY